MFEVVSMVIGKLALSMIIYFVNMDLSLLHSVHSSVHSASPVLPPSYSHFFCFLAETDLLSSSTQRHRV